MAQDTASNQNAKYETYIHKRLSTASRHIKSAELWSVCLQAGAIILAFFLITAIIDHWIWSLGAVGRWMALLALLSALTFHFVRNILPLLIYAINPLYAARALEEQQPSLKNSLINFLLFRSDRAGLRLGVYQTLQHQAASDLTHTPLDSAANHKHALQMGYVLAGVLIVCGAYVILSPKSFFQTAARVAAIWFSPGCHGDAR